MTAPALHNPALEAFIAAIEKELVLAQVLIRRSDGFELRHIADRDALDSSLQTLPVEALRAWSQFTENGAFRPLKSAPNLRNGWRTPAKDSDELEMALHHLYPGAIADWFAAQQPSPPITQYREFTSRQTGMYRITHLLSDAEAAPVIRAGCHVRFCLKRRLWSVPGLRPDAPEEKSLIPCLESCAVLLEFARKAVRIEQAEKTSVSGEDTEVIVAALELALKHPEAGQREADFSSPTNSRRIQLLIEKLQSTQHPRPQQEPQTSPAASQ